MPDAADRADDDRDAILDQRGIDAQIRDSSAQRVADEQSDEERSLIERDILTDLRERRADERELTLDDRERRVTEREQRLDIREADLDDRQRWLAKRESAADQLETEQAQQ
jgi:predicted signal transduction protein with EAL and GGDEF domain